VPRKAAPEPREKPAAGTESSEPSLEDLVAKMKTSDTDAQKRIRDATEKETLENIVQERQTPVERLDQGLRYGDQAQAYQLTVPGYSGGKDSYKADYVAQAVETNDKLTHARYEHDPVDGTECYEAAVELQEQAIEQQKLGVAESSLAQPLEMREKAALFKALHPREWESMYDRLKLAA
jgi:hypothetical protein